ncbi:MAG TPA: hypothetical protein VF644_17700 [Pyrinomonadaceae bacterium]|jgi:hypothetical protein
MKQLNISLTKEEIRIIHQTLNEVCNGIHFEESEFETRIGTDRDSARKMMSKLETVYKLESTKEDDFS